MPTVAVRYPKKVKVVEVGPRDGLQSESAPVETSTKIELVERLSETGLRVVESGSFVSPKRVPRMADSAEVMAGISRKRGVRYPVLVPNMRGFESALAAGAAEVAVFTTASETFSRKNVNRTIEESLTGFVPILDAAKDRNIAVRGYISCVLGCPYEGEVAPEAVAAVAARLIEMGCYEISLGDTIGVGTPAKARAMVDAVAARVPVERLAAHFHDTFGQALANILAVMERGIAVVDSSVAGLGGCPFAPGAAGNAATEDVLYMLDGLGAETGVDLDAVVAVGRWICGRLGRSPASKVSQGLLCAKGG